MCVICDHEKAVRELQLLFIRHVDSIACGKESASIEADIINKAHEIITLHKKMQLLLQGVSSPVRPSTFFH